MKTKTRLLPAVMSILIMTSLFCPVVNAAAPNDMKEPPLGVGFALVPAAVAAPEIAELIIGGITVVVSSAVVIEIGKHLGKTWDGIAENWDAFVKSVSTGVNNQLHAKQWIKVTSPEGKAIMTAVYECFNAGGSSGGKKDDKWYFEARRNHGQIEINTERMNEEQAVKEMGRGKDIMTLNRELAQKLVGRFEGLSKEAADDLEFDGIHNPAAGKFHHLHYTAHEMRLHCWIWKDI